MAENVLKSMARLVSFNEEEANALRTILKEKKIKRKEHLLREGEVCNYAAFIVEGCLHYYYIVDGEESTGQFFFENGWYSDYESFLSGEPSNQNIQALEDCTLYLLYRTDLEALYSQYPVFEKFGRLMAERAVLGLKKKNEFLTLQSFEQRYLQLIKDRPKVIERVSLKYIASYLGMKAESLSRIRKRLFDNKNS
ncbi:MAG: Crp/Fnr family transcriptional regulator [Gloeobacteraceae cyanobacterium ES-bin-316]|nr:Crp/Fnr family transcriptional regulator [Ferruginibacter sp.]